jgi:hypothetical protein
MNGGAGSDAPKRPFRTTPAGAAARQLEKYKQMYECYDFRSIRVSTLVEVASVI